MDARARVRSVSLLIALSLGLAACGGSAPSLVAASGPDPANFKPGIEHEYLPMAFGTLWVFERADGGSALREEVRALEEPRVILGIPCLALREEVYEDDVLAELTTEWFAQDRQGNVWKFGEESLVFQGGAFWRTEDSWLAGEGDAVPWMAFPAQPEPGQVLYGYRPGGEDVLVVASVSETVATPAGTFQGCMQVQENPDDPEDADIVLYAPETGRVQEENAGGKVVLTEIRPR